MFKTVVALVKKYRLGHCVGTLCTSCNGMVPGGYVEYNVMLYLFYMPWYFVNDLFLYLATTRAWGVTTSCICIVCSKALNNANMP